MCDQSKICIMPHVSRSIGALNVMYCTEIERNACAASCDWLEPRKEITRCSDMRDCPCARKYLSRVMFTVGRRLVYISTVIRTFADPNVTDFFYRTLIFVLKQVC